MKQFMFMLGVVTSLNAVCDQENDTGTDSVPFSNDVVLEWNEVAYQAFGGKAYQNSLMASRINAMVHIAMHDALNAIYPEFSTYAYTGKDVDANPIAAAASAAHTVLVHEIGDKRQYLDSALQKSLSAIPGGESKTRGIALGKAAGQSIITARSDDGSIGNPISPLIPTSTPGAYRTVPPFDFVFAPYWVDVRPFGLEKKDQFRCVQPPMLNSMEYAKAFDEVREMGRLESLSRTVDQSAYSNFWYEFSEAGWNRVARTIAVDRKLGLLETARLFALVDMAIADAYIAGWDSKFHYNLWRPYTAIRNADQDGNTETLEDLQWESLMPSPPVQDYPSTHSALGNAAATVMANLVGDKTPFTMGSPTAQPVNSTRSYTSLSQAADENADSRVRAGIHFRFACEAGQELGDKVALWILGNHLKPLKQS
ncbi:MAG TPA: vanadium-dependent haloperoxidase [Pricia sp.]|nr:vanadium-dependent haloperoxidase [Pricia sp.]